MTYAFKDIESETENTFSTLEYTQEYVRPSSRSGMYRSIAKRLIDISLVLLTSPISLGFVLLGAIFTAMDGNNPFFTQKRVGRGGREFSILKLRTMVPDADKKLEEYLASNPEARAEWDVHQKLKNDPRITKVGNVLRKTSLDELPQLWNVLIGDMSIVGPRPMMVEQKSLYPGRAYYLHRPGITGLWQISDRHATSFRARADYDTDYDLRLSLKTDMSIIWQTFAVVARGTGC